MGRSLSRRVLAAAAPCPLCCSQPIVGRCASNGKIKQYAAIVYQAHRPAAAVHGSVNQRRETIRIAILLERAYSRRFQGVMASLSRGRRGLIAGHEVTTGVVMGEQLLRQKFPYKPLFLLQLPFALPVGPTPVPRLPLLAISLCPPGRPLASDGPYLSDRPLSHDFLCWL